jgi:hypothetical protein
VPSCPASLAPPAITVVGGSSRLSSDRGDLYVGGIIVENMLQKSERVQLA